MNVAFANCSARSHSLNSCLAPALLCTVLSSPAMGGAFADGVWLHPMPCWPDKAMHAIHVVKCENGELKGRILLWNNPGCPWTFEDVQLCSGQTTVPPPALYCDCLHCPAPPRLWDPYVAFDPEEPEEYVEASNLFVSLYPDGEDCCSIGDCIPEDCTQNGGCPPVNLNDCNGHAPLPDGRIVVTGGGCGQDNSQENSFIFNPRAAGDQNDPYWQNSGNSIQMAQERWYPTCTTLPDGRIIVFSGSASEYIGDQSTLPAGCGEEGEYLEPNSNPMILFPEVFTPGGSPGTGSWQSLQTAGQDRELEYYPFMFVLPTSIQFPGTKLFCAGPGDDGKLVFDVDSETWQVLNIDDPIDGDHGSAVMYSPGKVLKSGGATGYDGCDGSRETARIDLTIEIEEVEWENPESMRMVEARKDHNLVLLPNGFVLAVGGQVCDYPCDQCLNCDPVLRAEWIDPNLENPEWTLLAEMDVPRGYHSTAVLLPDATVLSTGGENWDLEAEYSSRSGQVYKPPYLFDENDDPAARPVITLAPQEIRYGQTIEIEYEDEALSSPAPTISKVSFVRLAAVTHGFDQNQRTIVLRYTEEVHEFEQEAISQTGGGCCMCPYRPRPTARRRDIT